MKSIASIVLLLSAYWLAAQSAPPAAAPQATVPPQIKQAQQLNGEGKQDEALAIVTPMLAADPKSYDANLTAGIVLDLKGDYDKARGYLLQAVEVAPPERRIQALRTTAVSYAFTCDLPKVARYEQLAYDSQVQGQKFADAAGTANELARIYLECGDTASAAKWYESGYQTAMRTPNLSEMDRDLWNFRWEHAKARIAAREGNAKQADADVVAAKAILDKGRITEQQQRFYPYLTGYVAFYAGNYKSAIAELQKADQKDPFVLILLAQAYDKLGDQPEAMKYYRQVLTINAHSPTNAFARPLAKKKLGMGS